MKPENLPPPPHLKSRLVPSGPLPIPRARHEIRPLLVDLQPGPIPRQNAPVPVFKEVDETCPGQRVIGLPPEVDLFADDVFLLDHAGRGTRQIDAVNLIRSIFGGGAALPGLGLRGVTVSLNFVSGPVDNYAIAAHGLGSTAVQVTLTSAGVYFLAPWLVLDENRVEVHVSHSFTGPASALISALLLP